MIQFITIREPVTGRHITGKHYRDYDKGLCIDDERDVRHYVDFNRVVTREPALADIPAKWRPKEPAQVPMGKLLFNLLGLSDA